MKSAVLSLAVGGVLMAGACKSAASLYVDIDKYTPWVTLSSSSSSHTGLFDITSPGDGGSLDIVGYNPASQEILAAQAYFLFSYNSLQSRVEIDVEDLFRPDSPLSLGFSLGYVTLFGGAITGDAFLSLQDGQLHYTVDWKGGDAFYLMEAGLVAEAGPRSQSVPDGGMTLALLGLGLTGLGVASRRFKVC